MNERLPGYDIDLAKCAVRGLRDVIHLLEHVINEGEAMSEQISDTVRETRRVFDLNFDTLNRGPFFQTPA